MFKFFSKHKKKVFIGQANRKFSWRRLLWIAAIIVKELLLLSTIIAFALSVTVYLWHSEFTYLLTWWRKVDIEHAYHLIWGTDEWWWIEQDIRDVVGIDLWPQKKQFMRYIWEKDQYFMEIPFSQNDPAIFPQIYIDARDRVIKYFSIFFGQVFLIRLTYQIIILWRMLRRLKKLPIQKY